MTRDATDTPDWEVSTAAEFDSALRTLLRSGHENGLDLRGAWEYRPDQSFPNLEVLITEVAKQR